MLEILQTKNKAHYARMILKYGNFDDISVVEANEDGASSGYGVYKLDADCLTIYEVCCEDLKLYDGIVRAVLFLAALSGVEKAVFEMPDIEKAVKLGFITAENRILEPVDKVLNGCENCKNANKRGKL